MTTTISTLEELARAVDRPPPDGLEPAVEADDTVALLHAWTDQLRLLDADLVGAPTPSRGRTIAELTVNVFNPFDLLPDAWASGALPWHPELDEARSRAFATVDELTGWAQGVAERWDVFVKRERASFGAVRLLSSPRGELAWRALIGANRWHAAFHYRQVLAYLDARGTPRATDVLDLATLTSLELPPEVF